MLLFSNQTNGIANSRYPASLRIFRNSRRIVKAAHASSNPGNPSHRMLAFFQRPSLGYADTTLLKQLYRALLLGACKWRIRPASRELEMLGEASTHNKVDAGWDVEGFG